MGQVKETRPNSEFPKGSQYNCDGHIWRVTEEVTDSSTEWRRVVSVDSGDDEIIPITNLKRDLEAGRITFI